MKKALIVASVGGFIGFEKDNIKRLENLGFEVDIACAQKGWEKYLVGFSNRIIDIPFSRRPLSNSNIIAYKKIMKLIEKEDYRVIHCHTPIAGVITRFAARNKRKGNCKVLYTAHGFHFYKGAPLKNWLLYYPIEWICAHWTDVLITINKEDYARAKKHMHAGQVEYIPGVGVDLKKFSAHLFSLDDRLAKRRELGIPEGSFVLLSVGELNANKNHEVVIRAIARRNNKSIQYVIAGEGERRDYLLKIAEELGVSGQVHLLGFRNDMADLYHAADVCVFPSIREGLGIAAIEGMASGLPLICADNRGTREYALNGENAIVCRCESIDDFENAIIKMYEDNDFRHKCSIRNISVVKEFSVEKTLEIMMEIYQNIDTKGF